MPSSQTSPRPAARPTQATVRDVHDDAPGTLSVYVDHGSISSRVETYHNIARSCAAYAVFYGAMAGQELIALRQKVGSRKFQPTLEESMPWLSRSTAYLYIDYAEKFAARLSAICPAVGQIELATLPDPRDYEAAERTELFAQVRESTGAENVEQMWLALGLMREPKRRGGDTSAHRKQLTPAEQHEAWLNDCRTDFEAALMALDRVHDRTLWKAPSITNAQREVAADLLLDMARQLRAWNKFSPAQQQNYAASIDPQALEENAS